MAPKYGERSLSPLAKEFRNEIKAAQFDGRIQDRGNGRIDIDEAATFAAQQVEEREEAWESDNAHRLESPNLEAIRMQEATKRTNTRWRYGALVAFGFLLTITIAGLSSTGHL